MKSLIHKGYFKEMFRQLKVAGIVSAAILMASNIITFLSVAALGSAGLSNYVIPEGSSLASVMVAFAYIVGVLLTFSAFGWLNKRSLSDFYHGLPIKRTQIYFTTVFAIMAWMAIGLTAYAVVHALIYALLGAPFNYLLFLGVFANMLIGALEVVGAASLACAISGTRFVNLFATVVILFVPRFLFTILAVFIKSIDQSLSGGHLIVWSLSVFFNPTYNIIAVPYNTVLSMVAIDYANIGAMIYNLVYSLILVVLGWRAFLKRKSEAAGNPTTNKIYQAIIRIAVGLPLLLVLTYIIANGGTSITGAVLLVLFAFIAYCLYELISTKSAKRMAKAMPGFLICIAISALYLALAYGIVKLEYSVKVNENNITAYQPIEDDTVVFDRYFNRTSYTDLKSNSILYDDKESLDIIAKAYQRTVEEISKDGRRTYPNYAVRISRKGRDIFRNIGLTDSEMNRLSELREADKRYEEAMYTFPEGTKYYSVTYIGISGSKEIGKLFEEEYNTLTNEQKLSLKVNNSFFGYPIDYDGMDKVSSDFTLTVCGCLGPKNYSDSYYITKLTPKTLAKTMEILNEKNGKKVKDGLASVISWAENGGKYKDFDVTFGGKLSSDYSWVSFWGTKYSEKLYQPNFDENAIRLKDTDPAVYEILKLLANTKFTNDPDKGVFVTFTLPTSMIGSENLTVNLDLSQDEISKLFELLSDMHRYDVEEPVVYD